MDVNKAIYTTIGILEGHIFLNRNNLKKEDKEYITEIIDTLKSLEAENKAYRKMWEEFKDVHRHEVFQNETVKQIMDDYEKVYLGGKK